MSSLSRLSRTAGRWSLGLILGAVLGCGSEGPAEPSPDDATRAAAARYAQAICDAVYGCKCWSPFASPASCVEGLEGRFIAGVVDRGMTLDVGCLNTALDRLAEDPCGALEWLRGEGPPCIALQGDRAEGVSCSPHWNLPLIFANECGGDMHECIGGGCVSPFHTPPPSLPGDPCVVLDPYACGTGGQYCGRDGRCHLSAAEGDPCEARGCASGLYCRGGVGDELGVCSPREAFGAPCDPRDHLPCDRDPVSRRSYLCAPVEGRCTGEHVRICEVIGHPFVHPEL